MSKITIRHIIKTSIVTAFTIAAGLIWKDVIIDSINLVFPPSDQLLFKLLAAIIATIFVIIAIYVMLKTESEAEFVVGKIKNLKSKKVIEIKNEPQPKT